MPSSDPESAPTAARGRHTAPPAAPRHLLAVGLDRGRLEGVAALAAPHINLFVTASPQKALVWTRLETLDLILLRFGPPVEQALDLVQALIEANPAPPILLLVEPEAEAVAQHLARRQICAAQPASITTEQLTQQVLRLLAPPTGRPAAPHPTAMTQPAAPMPSVQPVHPLRPPVQLRADEPTPATPRRVTIEADTHRPPPPPAAEAPPTSPPTGWELPFLDQLVIELAHRLKNPLVSIKTFTHLLQERFNDADFRTRFYAIVNDDVVQLNEIVDRLLEFTEFSRPYPKPLNLADELKQATESLEPLLQGRQVTVQWTAPAPDQAGPLQIYADPMQFRYLLKQLLLDSAAAAPAGGRLQIRLLVHPAGLKETEPACAVLIDTTMASTAPRLHEWLSLELLLAKNLMERHRGTVTVAVSGDGNGDQRQRRVTALFPLSAPLRRHAQPPTPEPRTTSATIDRRRFPLSIAFRERRVSSRRQGHHTITFDDRRRRLEGGEGARALRPHEDRPRPGFAPPSASM